MNITSFPQRTLKLNDAMNARKAAAESQALTPEVAPRPEPGTSAISPLHFQAATGIKFGAATPALTRLKAIADADPAVALWLKESQLNAAKNGQAKADLKHMLLVLMNMGEKIAQVPDVLTGNPEQMVPLKRMVRYSVDALIPPASRNGMSAGQIATAIKIAKGSLTSVTPFSVPNAQAGEFDGSDSMQQALTTFFAQNNSDQNVITNFVGHLRNTLSADASKEYKQLGTTLKGLLESSKKAEVEDIVEVEEPKIPIYKRDTSMAGFKTRVEELRKKGVMTDFQYQAIQNILHSEGADGGGMFGGASQMDGGVTKKRLKAYLYQFDWQRTNAIVDPERTQKILDRDHYGLDDVKKEIVTYQSRLLHLNQRGQKPKKGKNILLVGPPGVGKTSIANAIAKANNRKMSRLSLSSIEKPSDLIGHSSTFVNAQPGRLFKAMAEAGSVNPIIIMDEVDKLKGDSLHGNVADTLLNILDPEQNDKVVDEFLGPEMPLDFSQTQFILTANDESRIPAPVLDRAFVIRLDGYDVQEKMYIAKNHLVPKFRKELALTESEFRMTDDALRMLIAVYTREAGVRELERKIQALADNMIARLGKGEATPEITPDEVTNILGVSEIFQADPVSDDRVGRVNGLAVVGGGSGMTMPILASKKLITNNHPNIPGSLRVHDNFPVGNLKKVIEESITVAWGWVDDNIERMGVEIPNGKDIVLKISPERISFEKDGDSAGAAFTTVISSALTGKPIRHDVAMTGTITLEGSVLAIGGVKQKLRGALQDNKKVVFLPKENARDVDRLPERMKEELNVLSIEEFQKKVKTGEHIVEGKMTVVPVNKIEDILNYALVDFKIAEKPKTDSTPQPLPAPVQFAGRRHLNAV